MSHITKSDCSRLTNINFTMDEIYSDVSNIYESLVDGDREQLRKDINKAIKTLKAVMEGSEDES